MKRVLIAVFAFAMTFSMAMMAQDQSAQSGAAAKGEKAEAQAAAKGKAMSLTGWVKTENGKTVFVNDKDKQTWNVSNPDALSGHDGMHVTMKANINEADKSLTVDSVKNMRKGKQTEQVQKASQQ